ncbi:hypothetical protein [Rhodococcus sp. KBW08]|uniref:hypothetical protein n=1 Tax=Rhodococcus sp. KBW08 TaxID=2144188 RepID=UPI0016277813|nr:hypothetical protein [Rhodococcus sp. KBW08]
MRPSAAATSPNPESTLLGLGAITGVVEERRTRLEATVPSATSPGLPFRLGRASTGRLSRRAGGNCRPSRLHYLRDRHRLVGSLTSLVLRAARSYRRRRRHERDAAARLLAALRK